MTTISVIENKISHIRKYFKILKKFNKFSQKQLKEDVFIRGALERYLYLVVQSTIDLAECVIAYKKYRKPSTLAENFLILQEEGFIDRKSCEKLVKMVGFRNIVAHDYEKIDPLIMSDILKNRVKDIEKFLMRVSKKL